MKNLLLKIIKGIYSYKMDPMSSTLKKGYAAKSCFLY